MERTKKTRKVVALILGLAWAFGVGYKTGRGKVYDNSYELWQARETVAIFHEALHMCVDSLEKVTGGAGL